MENFVFCAECLTLHFFLYKNKVYQNNKAEIKQKFRES